MFHGVGSWRASDMYYFGVKLSSHVEVTILSINRNIWRCIAMLLSVYYPVSRAHISCILPLSLPSQLTNHELHQNRSCDNNVIDWINA
jgi:hypothetical protein